MLIQRPISAVHWARVFIYPVLKNGTRAVDATAGNGHDTLFLAENTGPDGHVYALDLQEQALQETKIRINAAGFSHKVTLLLEGHQNLGKLVHHEVDAVMFNLGYLPGSDRTVITTPENTRDGILAALPILRPGGRMSIVVYTGHAGSREESQIVASLLGGLDLKDFNVQKMLFWNSVIESPELYFVTRTGGPNG